MSEVKLTAERRDRCAAALAHFVRRTKVWTSADERAFVTLRSALGIDFAVVTGHLALEKDTGE